MPKYTFSVPIISVGNIVLGGTGKTPFVYYLAQLLTNHGISHAVVSRGYQKKSTGTCLVHDGRKKVSLSPEECGDEPFLLASKLSHTPIITDNNKARGIRYAIKHLNPQIILLDDGFQSHYIDKQLEFVLFNILNTNQDLKLFPFGKLREDISSIARADLVVFTKQNLKESKSIGGADSILPIIKEKNIPYVYSKTKSFLTKYLPSVDGHYKHSIPSQSISDKHRLFSCCGIGDPLSFKKTSQPFSNSVMKHVSFQDHYSYQKNELKLLNCCQTLHKKIKLTGILTTSKDFVKIRALNGPFLDWCYRNNFCFFVLDIKMSFIKDEGLILKQIKTLIP